MTRAFRCEACGEYHDGRGITLYLIAARSAGRNGRTELKGDTCAECHAEIVELVEQQFPHREGADDDA